MDLDYINSLPLISFPGEIKLIRGEAAAIEAVEEIVGEDVVGFDTESRPSFRAGQNFPIALIQIATEEKAYLFQIIKGKIPNSLASILSDPQIEKVGIGLKSDIHKLKESSDLQVSGFLDLSVIAASKGFAQTGAKALTAFFLEKKLSKAVRISNWASGFLTTKQLLYAATDAWICLEIKKRLMQDQGIIE